MTTKNRLGFPLSNRNTSLRIQCFLSLALFGLVIPSSNADDNALPVFYSVSELLDQCGPKVDLDDVEMFQGKEHFPTDYISQHEASTVQLQWMNEAAFKTLLPHDIGYLGNVADRRWCTGTLIARDLVLTARHCFYQDWPVVTFPARNAFPIDGLISPQQAATLMQVNFRYQKRKEFVTPFISEERIFPIAEMLEIGEDETQDFAIVRLAKGTNSDLPGEYYRPAVISNTPEEIGDDIAIIQHPNGDPKKIGVGKITKISNRIIEYNDLDTYKGASGSGVRNVRGEIIGVHVNGGCKKDSNGNVHAPGNKAVRLSYVLTYSKILTDLKTHSYE